MTFSERAVEAAAKAIMVLPVTASAQKFAKAALSAALVVDGLVVVPEEPTLEMGEAAIASLGKDDDRHAAQVAYDIWTAMLTAASEGEVKPSDSSGSEG